MQLQQLCQGLRLWQTIPFKSTFCPFRLKMSNNSKLLLAALPTDALAPRTKVRLAASLWLDWGPELVTAWLESSLHFWEQAPDMVLITPTPSPAPCCACLHQTRKTFYSSCIYMWQDEADLFSWMLMWCQLERNIPKHVRPGRTHLPYMASLNTKTLSPSKWCFLNKCFSSENIFKY